MFILSIFHPFPRFDVDGGSAVHAVPGELAVAEIEDEKFGLIVGEGVIELECWFAAELANPVVDDSGKDLPFECGQLFGDAYYL